MALWNTYQSQLNQSTMTPMSQESIEKQLVVGASGKDVQSTAPKASNVGEQLALEAAKGQQQQFATQANLQQIGSQQAQQNITQQANLAQQERVQKETQALTSIRNKLDLTQKELDAKRETAFMELDIDKRVKIKQMSQTYNQQLKKLTLDRNIEMDNIFTEYSHGMQDVNSQRQLAAAERTAQTIALANKSYTSQLYRAAEEEQLNNSVKFKMKTQELAFGFDIKELSKDIQFNSALLEDKAKLQHAIESMRFEDLKEADAKMRKANQKAAMIQGGASLVVVGALVAGTGGAAAPFIMGAGGAAMAGSAFV